MLANEEIDDGPLSSKMHKVCCCPTMCMACNCLFKPCRYAVSGHKKRFVDDGFDLDLTIITPRIIVHGFPAIGIEHMYRNPRYEIKRFLDHHHPENYKMYNFCCEYGRGYDPSVYNGNVERYPFKDHNTPPLETMVAFANSAQSWLDENPEHVVSMHCKAGKGRAGLMCCVLLIRSGAVQSAKEALDLYDATRVHNNKGLTVTSQRKFVVFYEALWRQCWGVGGNIGDISGIEATNNPAYAIPVQPELRIFGVELVNLPPKFLSNYRIKIYKVTNTTPEELYDSENRKGNEVSVECSVSIQANFKVVVLSKPHFFSGFKKVLELLHNTYFMDRTAPFVDFGTSQLDIKRKTKAKLGAGIVLRLRCTSHDGDEDRDSSSRSFVRPPTSGYVEVAKSDQHVDVEMSRL